MHDQLLGWITKCPSWNERKHETISFGIKLNKILRHEVNAKMPKHLGGMSLNVWEVMLENENKVKWTIKLPWLFTCKKNRS